MTLTTHAGSSPRPRAGTASALFVVVECDRLDAGGSRHMLAGVDTVIIGRGAARVASRRDDAGLSILDLRLPDRRMSTTHARIERALGRWVLVDAGSKNGTAVNGQRVDKLGLGDGDVIEVGHTLMLFRSELPVIGGERPDVDTSTLRAPAPGMATLVPELALQLDRLEQVAPTDVAVLIGGETGTGKELIARAVHSLGKRRGELIAVNCGAIPDTLVESELFGHKKGAFSGAIADKLGHVRSADGGTLFLDEIGDLPAQSQAALLRVLQEREVVPVGASTPIPVDLRVVAATHRDLDADIEAGKFRRDLFARLSGLTIELPALRDRREDLGLLIAALSPPGVTLSRDAARALVRYDWPLNIRELQKCLRTAAALAGRSAIELEHLPEAIARAFDAPAAGADPAPSDTGDLTDDDRALRDELIALLDEHGGNVAAVARVKGKARMQIHRWLKRFGIELDQFRR